jgi:hypothetical protein
MQTRQQRRADERARAKTKVINPTAMQLCFAAALHPTLWRPAPKPSGTDTPGCECNHWPDNNAQPQPDHSSNAAEPAAGPVSEAMTETKTCSRCKEHKPPTEFSKDRPRPDGLNRYCRPCVSEAMKKYADRRRNPQTEPVKETKRCTRCEVEKPLKQFSRKKANRDGHHSHCKECRNTDWIVYNARGPQALKPDARLILTPEFMQQAHEKACKDWKAAEILRGVAGVENETPDTPRHRYTESGWPIDVFAISAERIRTQRYLRALGSETLRDPQCAEIA